jgi:hypothetical protein
VRSLERELARRTGRTDIEVTAGPYRSYDVTVSKVEKDHHPHVDFYSAMRWDPARVKAAVDYAVEMLQNWEAQNVIHEKAIKDSERFFETLKAKFPDMELDYSVIDSEYHHVYVKKEKDRLIATFDLWPNMTEADVEKLANYIREARQKVEQGATLAGFDY